MTALTVDAGQLPGLAEIVASLPLSLAPAGAGPAQLAAIDGAPGWAGRAAAALAAGAGAAVVAAPHDGSLAGLAADAASRVVLAWDFAANPAVAEAAREAAILRPSAVLADATLLVPSGSDLDVALLELSTTAARVFGDFEAPRSVHRDADGWHLAASLAGGVPLLLTIVATDAEPEVFRLRLITKDGGVSAVVPAPHTAAPAEVRVTGPEGERLLPTLWITSRRASWQRAVAVAAGDASGDVAELLRTVSVTSALR